jgi:rhamnogalacturonan endolyase
MKNFIKIIFPVLIFAGCTGIQKNNEYIPEGFVTIPAAHYTWKNDTVNLNEFEICDHTVTNAEYKKFVDATGYPAPLHWNNGRVPSGKEEFPVIFINRDDVEAFTTWMSEGTGRIYRLPTTKEFIWAASGGNPGIKYALGNDIGLMNSENVNFDPDHSREFNHWEDYLKPARWGLKNGFGLYNMAGNVWQLVEENIDPATLSWRYRIETLVSNNKAIMGGSWFSPIEYLGCGLTFGQPPGIRYPDLGFRLVRKPEGTIWTVVPRQLSVTTDEKGRAVLSWASLNRDSRNTTFNIYRISGDRRDQNGIKINDKPVKNTSYSDKARLNAGSRYQYRVIEVDELGVEGHPSEWTGVVISEKQNPVIMTFKPLFKTGSMTPVFGDLEGWNKKGCVIRLDNGNVEMSQDPGVPVQLEAFSSTGRSLWRKDIAFHRNIFGNANNAPFNVWDMDGDGKDEVITLLQIGEQNYAAILDGMSGNILFKTLWTKMATDYSLSSTRIQMSIAYLDGKTPAVITQTGIYENEIITAYDNKLNKLWDYKSFMETSGSGGHKIEVSDVDGDGKQEIFYGTTCLNADGSVRWSIYRQHPDLISIHDYLPNRPGPEVFFIIESSVNAGVYMVDASNGSLIWKNNREDDPLWSHGHTGWTADIWDGSPGMEAVSNRAGHDDHVLLLFSADGKKLLDSFPGGYTPLEWDGDATRELIGDNGKILGNFDGREIVPESGVIPNPVKESNLIFTADLAGDFRSELVISGTDTDGRKAVMVLSQTEPIGQKFISPSEDTDYRLWLARNKGGGYGQIYEYVLKSFKE